MGYVYMRGLYIYIGIVIMEKKVEATTHFLGIRIKVQGLGIKYFPPHTTLRRNLRVWVAFNQGKDG